MKKLFYIVVTFISLILFCGISYAQYDSAAATASSLAGSVDPSTADAAGSAASSTASDVSSTTSDVSRAAADVSSSLPPNTGRGGSEDRGVKVVSAILRPGVRGITSPILEFVPEMVFPDPARPGRDLTVRLRAYNQGGIYSSNITVEILTNEIFHLKGHDFKVKHLRLLCPLCSVQLNYYLTVDPNTKTGVYSLRFKVIGDTMISEHEMMVVVVSAPYIIIDEISTVPEKLVPGTSFILNMSLKNVETGNARNVVSALLLNQPRYLIAGKNPPVMPAKDNSMYIYEIKAGETIQVEFPLVVDRDADTGLSQVPIQLVAFDDSGAFNFSTVEVLGLDILGNAVLTPASISTDPAIVSRKENFILISRIENSGRGDARNVVVEINLPFSGVKKVFLGKIDADGDIPAVFNLKAKGIRTKKYNITLHYTDDLGEHVIDYPLELYVAPKLSLIELLLLIGLIIDIIIYAMYKEKSVIYRGINKIKKKREKMKLESEGSKPPEQKIIKVRKKK